jgi:transposase, IS6 family
MLSNTCDAAAATRFLRKALNAPHTTAPRVITVDKNPAYPKALLTLKAAALAPENCGL